MEPRVDRRQFLRASAGIGFGILAFPAGLARELASAAAAAPPGTATARIVFHGDRTKRTIALTVDDGWNPERVRLIFGQLQRAGVAATFMPYAAAMKGDPALWRRIASAGYPIGNHTTTHPDLTRLTSRAQLAEISTGRSIAEDITGHQAARVFRPPFGAYNQSVLHASVEAGFPTVVLWDTSDRDTSPHGSAQHMLDAALQGTNGSILLTHGGPPVTPTIMPAILEFYRSHGFKFVTLPEMLNLSGAAPGAAPGATPGATPAATPAATSRSAATPRATRAAPRPTGRSQSQASGRPPPATPHASSTAPRPTASDSGSDAVLPGVVVGSAVAVTAVGVLAAIRSRLNGRRRS